jgi:hypothetical protein
MEEFITGALDSAFSIAVAGYLLIRMERRLDELTSAIARLETAIISLPHLRGEAL